MHKLNVRFGEENIKLLQFVSCLSPTKSFETFDENKLLRIAEFLYK